MYIEPSGDVPADSTENPVVFPCGREGTTVYLNGKATISLNMPISISAEELEWFYRNRLLVN